MQMFLLIFLGDLKEACQTFILKLYYEESEESNVLVDQITLNLSSSYWFLDDFVFRIPVSTLKTMCKLKGTGAFHTSINVSNYEYILNSFDYDSEKDSINGYVPEGPEDPTSPDYTEKFDELNSSINDLNNTQQDTNNFLKDDSINDSDFQLPTVEVEDPSSNFFDTIFMGVYNSVTVKDDVLISFDVMNTHVNVSSADFNFLTDSRFSILRSLLSMFWIFGIGIFILRDIRKILDKIKSGNVDTAITNDVKADMV